MKNEIIQDTGYGLIPKRIMRDKNLSIQAKAIYSYLASFAGNTGQAFPSVSLMLSELDISRDTFYKYRNELEAVGAITVKKERDVGKFERNIYFLSNSIKSPCPKSSDTVSSYTVSSDTTLSDTVSSDTISNSLISNSLISNNTTSNSSGSGDYSKIVQVFQDNGFGLINSTTKDILVDLIEDYSSEWVLEALEMSVMANVRKINYAIGILKKWKAEGKDNGKHKSDDPGSTGKNEEVDWAERAGIQSF